MAYYIALIHKEPESDFGVSFPDLPGCITAGSTLQEALEMAREALAGHLAAMAADGDEIPEPSSMDAIMADPENRDGVAVLVPAPELQDRAVRLNVTLPEGLVRRIDKVSRNRSRFLAEAAEQKLASRRETVR